MTQNLSSSWNTYTMLKERCSLFVLWSQLFLGDSNRSDTFPETTFPSLLKPLWTEFLSPVPTASWLTQLPSWTKTVSGVNLNFQHQAPHVQLSRAKPTARWINQPLRSQTDGLGDYTLESREWKWSWVILNSLCSFNLTTNGQFHSVHQFTVWALDAVVYILALFPSCLMFVLLLSLVLAQRIPLTEEPGRLQSMGSQRVWPDWATNTLFLLGYTLSPLIKV